MLGAVPVVMLLIASLASASPAPPAPALSPRAAPLTTGPFTPGYFAYVITGPWPVPAPQGFEEKTKKECQCSWPFCVFCTCCNYPFPG